MNLVKGGEKQMKKQIMFPVMAAVILGAVTFGTTVVSAQSATGDPQSSLITKIAQKFNLQESEVKAVFDQEHTERHAKMQQQFSENLSQLVTDGNITEAQKTAILSKMEEMRTKHEENREAMMNMTPDERRAAMEKERAALEAWAKEQGIDLSLIKGFRFGKGPGFGHGRGMKMEAPQQ